MKGCQSDCYFSTRHCDGQVDAVNDLEQVFDKWTEEADISKSDTALYLVPARMLLVSCLMRQCCSNLTWQCEPFIKVWIFSRFSVKVSFAHIELSHREALRFTMCN